MPQTVFGQTVALADVVVAMLNNAAPGFCLPITAVRRFARLTELKDLPKTGSPVAIDIFPGTDTSERDGVAPSFSDTYAIHVLLQQHVGKDATSEGQISLLMQLRSQIAEFLMPRRYEAKAAVHPFTNIPVVHIGHGKEGVYDLVRLEELQVFYAEMIVMFNAPGLGRKP